MTEHGRSPTWPAVCVDAIARQAAWNEGYRLGHQAGWDDAILARAGTSLGIGLCWAAGGSLLAFLVLGIAGADRVARVMIAAGCWSW